MKANYIVLRNDFLGDLVNEINKKIKAGYRPVGGIAIECHERGDRTVIYYLQAMVEV